MKNQPEQMPGLTITLPYREELEVGLFLTNLQALYVVHLVVADDVEHTVNDNFLCLLGQNNVLNTRCRLCPTNFLRIAEVEN